MAKYRPWTKRGGGNLTAQECGLALDRLQADIRRAVDAVIAAREPKKKTRGEKR